LETEEPKKGEGRRVVGEKKVLIWKKEQPAKKTAE